MDALWQPLIFALLAGCAFAPLEWLAPERGADEDPLDRAEHRERRRTDLLFASVGSVLTALALAVGMGLALGALARIHARVDLLQLGLPTWAALPLALLIFELAGYAYHRAAHRVPALWRLHAVHHSAPRMDWLASFRQHPVEVVLMTLAQNAPLVLLGIPLGAHALVVILLAINTVFVHANLRLGPRTQAALGWLIATPRFHHRHHARAGEVRNYATLLPVLDRLFGTHSDARARRVGLDEALPTGFLGLLVAPLRRKGRGLSAGG